MPPIEILLETLPAAGVSAAVLLAAWRWRDRTWPVPVALGLGYATSHALARGLPPLDPPDSVELLFHFALAGALVGVLLAGGRLPAAARWAVRAVVSTAVAWLLLRNLLPHAWPTAGERILWLGVAGGGLFASWAALDWRAGRVGGWSLPLALLIVTGGGAVALAASNSGALGQMAGMLSAAIGPLLVYAWLRREAPLGAGGVTVYVILASALWIAGAFFADLPAPSAILLAVAPLAAPRRRGWLGTLIVLVLVGLAVFLALSANAPDPDDPYAGYS